VFGNFSLRFEDEDAVVCVDGSSPIEAAWGQNTFAVHLRGGVHAKYILVVEKVRCLLLPQRCWACRHPFPVKCLVKCLLQCWSVWPD
jgi:hypothetical protein